MSLTYIHQSIEEERRDFLDDLRNHEPETIAPDFQDDDPRLNELSAIKEDLFRIDDQLRRLIDLRPDQSERYKQQFAVAISQIESRVRNIFPHRYFQ